MLTTEGWGGSPPVGPHLPRHPRVPLAFSTSAVLGGPSNRMTWTFPPEGSDPQLKDLIPPPLSDWLLRETALAHRWGGGGGNHHHTRITVYTVAEEGKMQPFLN